MKDSRRFATASRWCLLANTPAYLYKHLRDDPEVLRIARLETAEIASGLAKASADEVYVHLVALSHKPLSEFRGILNNYVNDKVRWLDELKQIILQNAASSQITTLAIPPLQVTASGAPSATSGSKATVAPRIITSESM